MKMRKTLLCILVVWIISASAAAASSLHLSIASSMTDVFREVISEYGKAHPNIKVLVNYSSSGALAKQIAQGAPADIYISANPAWMAYLVDEQAIEPSSVRIFAHNKLVFIGSPELQLTGLQDLPALKNIGIGNPMSVPAGQYARQAMEAAGIYDSLRKNRQLVLAKDVRQALLYADRGEVDGAFVYHTDAVLAGNCKILFMVPGHLYPRVSYPIGITVHGVEKKEVESFYAFITGKKGAGVLQRYGFEPVLHDK